MSQSAVVTPVINVSIVKGYQPDMYKPGYNPAGMPLPIYLGLDGYYYVQADHNQEYAISTEIKTRIDPISRWRPRLEIAGLVDGRDTMRNQPANIHRVRGMVVSGNHYVIPGYGIKETSPFVFTVYDEQTVAVQATGSNEQLGVIVVACWTEQYVPPIKKFNYGLMRGDGMEKSLGNSRSLESASFGSLDDVSGVGTKMGDRVDHREVGSTQFDRAFGDPTIVTIYAKPLWWLRKKGILPERPVSPDRDHPTGLTGSNDYR